MLMTAPEAAVAPAGVEPVVRAMLFGDFKGFSSLCDEQFQLFYDQVMGAIAGAIDRHAGAITYVNTWGDAICIFLTDCVAAADCALAIQESLGALDLGAGGFSGDFALRLSGHVGTVLPIHDPVRGTPCYTGLQVTHAARIEPVTPPGTVYITEPFADAIMLAGRGDLRCADVGYVAAAKNAGRLRMYRLQRARATGVEWNAPTRG